MSIWKLTEFAGVDLPIYNTTADFTGGRAESPLKRTVNGTHDIYAGQRVIPLPPLVLMQGIYAEEGFTADTFHWVATSGGDTIVDGAGNYIVWEAAGVSVLTAREQVDDLRALIGSVGTLVRVATDDEDVVQQMEARLLEVRLLTRREWADKLVQVDCRWEAASDPYWLVDDEQTATGLTLHATIGGNAPVLDAVLTLTGAIASSATITGEGHDLVWTGVLGAGDLLVISGMTATADGDPTSLAWGDNHTHERLLQLEPGSRTLTITGAAAASLSWYDKWQ